MDSIAFPFGLPYTDFSLFQTHQTSTTSNKKCDEKLHRFINESPHLCKAIPCLHQMLVCCTQLTGRINIIEILFNKFEFLQWEKNKIWINTWRCCLLTNKCDNKTNVISTFHTIGMVNIHHNKMYVSHFFPLLMSIIFEYIRRCEKSDMYVRYFVKSRRFRSRRILRSKRTCIACSFSLIYLALVFIVHMQIITNW